MLSAATRFGIYSIDVYSKNDGINPDFVFYIEEFFNNRNTILSSFFCFFAVSVALIPTVVGTIYFVNVYGYFPLYTTKLDANGENYDMRHIFEDSKGLAKNRLFQLIITNSLVVLAFGCLYYIIPNNLSYKDIDVTRFLRYIFIDSVSVYYLYTGINLQKDKSIQIALEEKKLEEEKHERRQFKMDGQH
jgi:hypothetical protein